MDNPAVIQAECSIKCRRNYDNKFKLDVINVAEQLNNSAAARMFGIKESNVRRWKLQKNLLEIANATRKSFRGPKEGRHSEIDRRVMDYAYNKLNRGIRITRRMMQIEALKVAKELNIEDFKASLGWCCRLMRRKGFSLKHQTVPDGESTKGLEEECENLLNDTESQSFEFVTAEVAIKSEMHRTESGESPVEDFNEKGVQVNIKPPTQNKGTNFNYVRECRESATSPIPITNDPHKTVKAPKKRKDIEEI